ncbi:MAG: Ubiquinone biosynthesis O-methyltransferase [Candidatus Anoxychlamydiales bacterium]|nr:Ubiquinone biosynthesis O-methyltransferase [Candidatus Anoxychlamydiales bacterium]NGX36031.1 Ubiquinone biosynthesis O-methyltransferase [Candidatus Anoxychlamydiales bacterium]
MKCRVCDEKDFELIVDLKEQPCGLHFITKEQVGKEPFYPLRVIYCKRCQTAQLDYTLKKEVMYSDHTYLSGITKSLREHFDNVAKDVDDRFLKNQKRKNVLDIGSNDGTQLKSYKELGFDVLGVDASYTAAKIANENNIETLNAFFNLKCANEINKKFDVINASGVFFHLEELHSVTDGIKKCLKDDGVFVVQFMYMKNIVQNIAFDQIYHEHLLYYTLKTIEKLLNRHGLSLFDAYFSSIHGGSIIGFVSHTGKKQKTERLLKLIKKEEDSKCNEFETYLKFAKNIEILKRKNLEFLEKRREEGKTIYAMGAPVKGNTLLNYFEISKDTISYLVEKNPLRKNMFSPGRHIPIIMEDEIKNPPDVYYVLAWNFKKEILKNNQHLLEKGVEFYFPINPKE